MNWVSIKDKLPDVRDFVAVWVIRDVDGDDAGYWDMAQFHTDDGGWWELYNGDDLDVDSVSHWMKIEQPE